ncbi:MAG: hypothetical protein PHV78_00465 [Patescibacteria group bacterium]|nr:hypothetical protein [Patescibacteria group bacterium]MDD5121355.1 hypothetical protein [Patescibacteria group bacterium]MDD5222067.1 hypothetical protein [Patescibacteria group bacterium]MDD5395726.1 hypothetical protein [Patescibacteria group bacterium]
MHVIHEPDNFSFERIGIKGKIFPIKNLTDKTHYFLIETETGHGTTILEHESDFIYYVLEGSGYFLINNIKEECAKGDLVIIPHNNRFTYKGKLKMIATATPPFRSEQEETLVN